MTKKVEIRHDEALSNEESNDAVKAKLLNKNKHIKYFNTSIFNIYPLLKLNIF